VTPYLDDDLIALCEQARLFASDRVAPGFQEHDRTRVLDRWLMKEIGAMGFIDVRYGLDQVLAVLTHLESAEQFEKIAIDIS
jgi:hypothetical protein